MTRLLLTATLLVLASLKACAAPVVFTAGTQPARRFEVHEASIVQIHAALKAGRITCVALVDQYLKRIEAYDKTGPALNAITVINPNARAEATELDRRMKTSGPTGPLHCIPAIVKDNFETAGLQTAAGSLALKNFDPGRDAFQVKRIKDAGAIVLAKSNMAEWAFSPYETVNSVLPGYSRNPYALDRVTAGSSGGTAAAVAASFGAIGLGSDTGNSIRGPSSHQALVGIRSTMGLTSRGGVVPLNLLADIAGPMTRTVEDAVAVFQAIVGEDPGDPVTLATEFEPVGLRPSGRPAAIPNYRQALVRGALKGARIGILRQAYERPSTSEEVVAVFMAAVGDMKKAGAIIVDPATVEGLDQIRRGSGSGPCGGFKHDINRYLASLGDRVPVKNLEAIIKSRSFHPSVELRLTRAQEGSENGLDSAACKAEADYRERFRTAVLRTMDAHALDAFIYPTWSNPPRLIGDLNTPHGDNSQVFSPTTGFPAINVPMGYTMMGRLPAGVTFFGRAWDEERLIRLAYSYEQTTRHRRPPATTPPVGASPRGSAR
ncbi:MAG TPA: amidase family protein [Vicinamibacterales bacterium]|nr:amidase family protein [Vicinamibacterales bacterium]